MNLLKCQLAQLQSIPNIRKQPWTWGAALMKTIAAVVSVYGQGSHSDVLLGKFLPGRGIPLDDGFHPLRVKLVALH